MGCTTSKAAKKPTNMKEDNSVKGKKSKGIQSVHDQLLIKFVS